MEEVEQESKPPLPLLTVDKSPNPDVALLQFAENSEQFLVNEVPVGDFEIPPAIDSYNDQKFDLMQINITIYGLSGVISVYEEQKKRRGSVASSICCLAGRKKSQSLLDTLSETDMKSLDTSVESIEAYYNSSAPTTAVVSCQRNAISSTTPMETFLPSMPLTSKSNSLQSMIRYKANWRTEENPEGRFDEIDKVELSTFKLIRAMKRESYHPGSRLGHINNYVHETVDLRVCVGCGKELLPLGIASLVVTGDEEGEVIMNIPAKVAPPNSMLEKVPSCDTIPRKRKNPLKPKKRNRKMQAFSHDPQRAFRLEENATLRVGVRVMNHRDVEQASQLAEAKQQRGEDELETLLKGMVDENLIIEIEGETSFLEQENGARNENDDKRKQSEHIVVCSTANIQESKVADNDPVPNFFCYPFRLYLNGGAGALPAVMSEELEDDKGKKTVLKVFSSFSSVSDSADHRSSDDAEEVALLLQGNRL